MVCFAVPETVADLRDAILRPSSTSRLNWPESEGVLVILHDLKLQKVNHMAECQHRVQYYKVFTCPRFGFIPGNAQRSGSS